MLVVSLSIYTEEDVRRLFESATDLDVRLGPDPPASVTALREVVRDADLVIADARQRHRLSREVLATMDRCRLIQMPAVGYESVDHLAAAELGIPVANAAGYNRDSVADWTLMAILLLLRRAAWLDREMRAGRWPRPLRADELRDKTVGIIGMGNVGTAVAERLRPFGARTIFSDPVQRTIPGAEQVPLSQLLAESEIVCVHAPLDPTTRGFLDAAAMARMRPGALLVNAARGALVDETALVSALRSGHIGGAALDVYATEPLPPDSPLRAFDEQVLLSPHAAGTTQQAVARVFQMTGENLRRVAAGLPPRHVVNGVPARRL